VTQLWSIISQVRGVQTVRAQELQTRAAQAIVEQQLREIEAIYQTAPVGLCFVDTDLRFVRLNERLAEINGLPVAAHIGRTVGEVLPSGDQLELLYRQVIESGEPILDLELSGTNPARPGVTVYCLVGYYPQKDDQGRVVGVNAMVQEITDRKRDQAALEERNEELDAFVFVVSHDLKAPLRAVANLSQWIEEDLEGQLTEDTQMQMNLLRSRVNRMSATIDGLLEYARIGRSESEIESVALGCLLADVVDEVSPPPTFTIDLPDDLPTLLTKRLLLFQIFVNLVGNGIKHHHSETGSIKISMEDRGDWCEFAIADDGPGIAPEDQERMFKIFQAVNPQNRSDSTGIGLAIVKKIIEAEGGTIWLESEIGSGTTFYFTWPRLKNRVGAPID
jgi:PAS domain S-box-containing protein